MKRICPLIFSAFLLGLSACALAPPRKAAIPAVPKPVVRPHPTVQAPQNRKEKPPPAKARLPAARPAKILSRLRLAPAAGNGLGPMAAALDTKRDRLYVLNNLSRNLSVVDLAQRRVIAVAPLPFRWEPEDQHPEMLFDPRADRVFIALSDISDNPATYILAVSASTLKLKKTRRVEEPDYNTDRPHIALHATRRELYIAYPTSITVLDARSLKTKRQLPVSGTALAVDETANLLFSAEPTGKMEEARVVARNLRSGKMKARSAPFLNVDRILVDPSHNRVIVRHYKGGYSETALLARRTLRKAWGVDFPLVDRQSGSLGKPEPQLFDTEVLDAKRERAFVRLYSGRIGVLDLRGRSVPKAESVQAVFFGEETPIYVHARTGQALVLANNGLFAFDGKTMREAWRLPLGADIAQIFLDRQQHRLLADVETDVRRLEWAHGRRAQLLSASPEFRPLAEGRSNKPNPRSHMYPYDLMAVDFQRRWLYKVHNGYLNRLSLNGKGGRAYLGETERFFFLVIGKSPGRFYRVHFPSNTDLAEPRAWVGVYQGLKEIKQIQIGHIPDQVFYVPAKDQLYLVTNGKVKTLSGHTFSLPRGKMPQEAEAEGRVPPDTAVPIDADTEGQFVYYADPFDRVVYKLRLSDGKAVAARRLPFAPTTIAVDSGAKVIHLVDWWNGSLVRIRLF